MRVSSAKSAFASACCAVGALAPSVSTAQDEGGSQSVAFYVVGFAIDGSVGVGDASAEVDLSASEFFDELEWGGMGTYRYEQEMWSFQVDVIYATLAGAMAEGPGAELDLSMIEVDGGYRLNEALEIVVGARGWQYDAVVITGGGPVEGDRSWTDPLIGARLTLPLGAQWELITRADIGGFGVGSEFAWHATVATTWNISESFGVLFGYRIFDVDLDDDDGGEEVSADLQHSGPAIGVSITF